MARRVRTGLNRSRLWLAGKYREVPLTVASWGMKLSRSSAEARAGGVSPENLVWIFGSGRSGSTWLRSMMGDMDRHRVWEEPLVGRLFGEFYERAQHSNLSRPDFIMAAATRKGWTRSIRNFVLDGAGYARPLLGPDDYLVIKEPNGSTGAPLLMEALPESRMILLIRDPRDVVASTLDGAKEGNWLHEWRNEGGKNLAAPDGDPETFVRVRSRAYLQHAGNAKRAYDLHRGRKVFVRYEELRENTLGTMKRIYSALEIPVDEKKLARVVEKHAWENIPEKNKGEGKFYRKATPGGWREDLTPRQARLVENIAGPLLKEFYPENTS
ncbi:MAG TPA: sulfotransferase [Rubrobacteraceae bacterium]|nr:sulfotransferase [Rubrobacteraceae bacterium]